MRKGAYLLLGLFVAVIAIALLMLESEAPPPPAAAAAPAPAAESPPALAVPTRLAASAVLAIDPRAPARVTLPAPPPTLFNEYLGEKSYRALYERLRGSAAAETAEGRLVLYEILRQCATITEGRRPGYRPNPPKREDFVAGIAPNDPQRERRIAAYDEFIADRCGGLEGVIVTHAELMKLLNDAAAAGDPRAQALQLEQQLWQSRRAGGGDWRRDRDGGVTLSDAQIASLQQLAATKDPEAIRVVGRVLSNSWHDYALRLGADAQPVEPRALMNAWLVLACEYGAPCGADTPRMLEACALRGHCNAQNYPDYLYYYGSTPHDSQLLIQYRETLRQAIEAGNWSQVQVIRGIPPSGNRMTFIPGPR